MFNVYKIVKQKEKNVTNTTKNSVSEKILHQFTGLEKGITEDLKLSINFSGRG